MNSSDEISAILFEVDFGSCCGIDVGWLDFLLMYKRTLLGFFETIDKLNQKIFN